MNPISCFIKQILAVTGNNYCLSWNLAFADRAVQSRLPCPGLEAGLQWQLRGSALQADALLQPRLPRGPLSLVVCSVLTSPPPTL